ncbi:late control protein [Paraneptunicella aestuarii]|uniref:phage late control D family protein n=1 Tax=Paraneptunicella aestuarii TaxID=2831148 RepID=UPI001E4C279B|nr:contractile injection system protein, VgrG/Pvc8 family [Paraneptunicella aestuarii]UAA38228.1 late control protein [Paraneptunicella aestuarii]
MGLTPSFKILAESNDISAKIKHHLIGITVTDNADNKSDTVEITLDDENNQFALPEPKAKLEVWLGYKETKLQKLGIFTVDEIEFSGSPSTLVIRAKSADLNEGLKEPKTKTWQKPGTNPERIKLTEIVEEIAENNNVTAKIGADFKDVDYDVVNQTNESDLNLLTRLGSKLGAIAKPADNKILFITKGEAKSASGKTLPQIFISPSDVSSWSVSIVERGNFNSVVATYYDTALAKEVEVPAGKEKPVYSFSKKFKDEAEAKQAANSQLKAFQRGKKKLSLQLPGHPSLMAEAKLTLSGFRDGVNGDWVAESVTHTLGEQGYTASIQATIKDQFEEGN